MDGYMCVYVYPSTHHSPPAARFQRPDATAPAGRRRPCCGDGGGFVVFCVDLLVLDLLVLVVGLWCFALICWCWLVCVGGGFVVFCVDLLVLVGLVGCCIGFVGGGLVMWLCFVLVLLCWICWCWCGYVGGLLDAWC
jgi:hypothetical protein